MGWTFAIYGENMQNSLVLQNIATFSYTIVQ